MIEVGLAYGGASTAHRVTREELVELLGQSDARTLRQFLASTSFEGLGARLGRQDSSKEAGTKDPRVAGQPEAEGNRQAAPRDAQASILHDGQTMNVLRYANRVPLQFQAGACAITQTVTATNWRQLRAEPVARLDAAGAGHR